MRRNITYWNSMYQRSLDTIPWEIKDAPTELKGLLPKNILIRGNALDIACGTGNYSRYLARNGFDVMGVDFSEEAIRIAKKQSRTDGHSIKYIVHDVLDLTNVLKHPFDFILDYSLLHHVAPDEINQYTSQFPRLLKKNGYLLLTCYSNKDPDSEGKPIHIGEFGNAIYYRTRKDVLKLYDGLKLIEYKECRLGKKQRRLGHCFLFQNSEL